MGNTGPVLSSDRPQTSQGSAVVVGAGVIGTTTSYFLAKAGYQVVCLDTRKSPDAGREYCSFRNGSLICPSLASPWVSSKVPTSVLKSINWRILLEGSSWKFFVHAARLGWITPPDEKRAALYNLAAFSKSHFDKILPTMDVGQRAQGTLQVVLNPTSVPEFFSNAASKIQSLGCEINPISLEECMTLAPRLSKSLGISGGVHAPNDTSADIYRFNQALRQKCEALGVEFKFGVAVDSVQVKDGQAVAVVTKDGQRFDADSIVLSAGIHTQAIARTAGVDVPILPVKGYVITVPLLKPEYVPRATVVIDSKKLYVCPVNDSLTISGLAEMVGVDHTIDVAKAQLLLDSTCEMFEPNTLDVAQANFHTCLRPLAPDDIPIIGPTKQVKNLFINAGHGSKGWTQSMGAGALITELIMGSQPSIDPKPYSPDRFSLIGWENPLSSK